VHCLKLIFIINSSFFPSSQSFVCLLSLFIVAAFFLLLNWHWGRVLLGFLGTFVLLGVRLNEWRINWVEASALLILVTIANINLLNGTLVVEAVSTRPLQRSNHSDAV
jgi:cell division protein FtsL